MRKQREPSSPRIERAAEWLFEAHRKRERYAALPAELAPQTMQEAYAIQGGYVARRGDTLGTVAGYKVAITTPALRRLMGIDDSVAGDVLEKTIRRAPATLKASDYVHLLVEFELAMELAEDLPAVGAPYTRERVAQAVGAVMPTFEVLDDRNADYSKTTALMLVADNAWNEGMVLGSPVRNWKELDLASLHGVGSVNGKPVGEGYGRDVLGHPMEALAWVANNLAARGLGLWRSDIITTGTWLKPHYPKAGDVVRFAIGRLGEVEVRIE